MQFTVIGRVLPERAAVQIQEHCFRDNESGGVISIICIASQLRITINDSRVDGWISAAVTARHMAQTLVSSLGYALGCGYSVEIVQVIDANGQTQVIGVQLGEAKFEEHEPVFHAAVELARRDVHFRFALQDYARALVDPIDCAHFCFRAIEAIRSSFRDGNENKNAEWARMHACLHTRREMIDEIIKPFADSVRHGDWEEPKLTTQQQRDRMVLLTRGILEAYRAYREGRQFDSEAMQFI